jgi:acetyl-CoA acyltransferase
MKERIAIIDGVRSPFCKASGVLKDMEADDLGALVVRELMERTGFPKDKVDELVFGNVLQPPHATNIARVISIKGGLPTSVPAFTVNRNCASGMEALSTAMNMIRQGEAQVIVAGGVESMSNFPVLFGKKMRDLLQKMSKAKTWQQKLGLLSSFRPSYLKPEIPEIADPICGLNMGQTAENLARDFKVTREEQDIYSLLSQQRAEKATKDGILSEEIVPVPIPPRYDSMQVHDDGPRANATLEALAKLKPAFDSVTGTVTAGNSSQVTDGAAALLVMSESKAKELGLQPIGYIREYASAGLDPSRMGLGPIYATAKLLDKTGLTMKDLDLIEINEAFASQIVALERAFTSKEFAKNKLGRDEPLGELGRERLNVNGGAIALGHPLGASGARLVLTLLKELKRRNKNVGLATLCVGGGQGEAMIVEVK